MEHFGEIFHFSSWNMGPTLYMLRFIFLFGINKYELFRLKLVDHFFCAEFGDLVHFPQVLSDSLLEKGLYSYFRMFTFWVSVCFPAEVELTWDDTDHERVTAMNRKFNKDELLQMDFNAYLASSSDDDDDEDGVEKEEELPEGKKKKWSDWSDFELLL